MRGVMEDGPIIARLADLFGDGEGLLASLFESVVFRLEYLFEILEHALGTTRVKLHLFGD